MSSLAATVPSTQAPNGSSTQDNDRKVKSEKVAPSSNGIGGKKRKRHSPFRIKAGCIVALRSRPGGNDVKVVTMLPDGTILKRPEPEAANFAEVWTDPLPGRDEGLALIGRRIRCCFPKTVGDHRILEGEVVSLIHYDSQFQSQRQKRRQGMAWGTAVELLVEEDVVSLMPFLEILRTDNDGPLSSSEQKRRQLEDTIRGKHKVSVKAVLADASRTRSRGSNNDESLTAKWVIQKRIALWGTGNSKKKANGVSSNSGLNGKDPEEPNGKIKRINKKPGSESITRYMGDGHDAASQQERNFRWLAGRSDDMTLQQSSSDSQIRIGELSIGMVGEVLRVTPSLSPSGGSLATVTMRRMVLPEHTKSGRMSYHGVHDLFDDGDSRCQLENSKRDEAYECLFQVPVEEVVIIHRRAERAASTADDPVRTAGAGIDCVGPIIGLEYSLMHDSYRTTMAGTLATHGAFDSVGQSVCGAVADCKGGTRDVCHRCRRTTVVVSRKKVAGKPHNGELVQWRYFCQECHDNVKSLGKEKSGSRFGLPCDCRVCSEGAEAALESRLASSVDQACHSMERKTNDTNGANGDRESSVCSVCGNVSRSGFSCGKCWVAFHKQCMIWDLSLVGDRSANAEQVLCRGCRTGEINEDTADADVSSIAATHTINSLSRMRPVDFGIPADFMEMDKLPNPPIEPIKKAKKLTRKTVSRKSKEAHVEPATDARASTVQPEWLDAKLKRVDCTTEASFEATCSRLVPYEPRKNRFSGATKASSEAATPDVGSPKTPTSARKSNERQGRKRARDADTNAKKSTSRAARANQRRMMKDVAAIGASGLELDLLAGREQQLRFDRSGIHAWGVFADVDIGAGDMVVEYRGELIGNAVAEKRENEYQIAKIGSDYMFRIDAFTVCDATKQGNVARFINASCDPNCYTQIVTLNGVKRIVIYAKNDIPAGQELCYDYKFAFEYDESKRIECHCGALNCRGFMNWDKRYIALPQTLIGGQPDPKPGRK